MSLPFTPEQFLGVFAEYNDALWPVVVAFWLASLGVLVVTWRKPAVPQPRAYISACGALDVERRRVSRLVLHEDQSGRVAVWRGLRFSGGTLPAGWCSYQDRLLLIRQCDSARWREPRHLCSRVPLLDDGIRSSIPGSADVRCAVSDSHSDNRAPLDRWRRDSAASRDRPGPLGIHRRVGRSAPERANGLRALGSRTIAGARRDDQSSHTSAGLWRCHPPVRRAALAMPMLEQPALACPPGTQGGRGWYSRT